MSQQTRDANETLQDAVNGFSKLKARQVSIDSWRVLSWRNGGITAHEVDIRELTCDCMDMAAQKRDAQICDHLAVALHSAPRTLDVGDAISEQMLEQMLELDDHVRAIERRASGIEAEQSAQSTASTESSAQSGSGGFDGDPVDQFQAVLESNGIDHTAYDIWVDEDRGSLQIDDDGYIPESQFEKWKALRQELDIGYDADDDVNYITPDQFDEVLSQ
jgi:hypothetical protein